MEQFFCKVCDIKCTGCEPYEQHLDSAKHKKKVGQAKIQATVKFDGSCYCPTCRISCSGVEPFLQHMSSEKHKKKEEARLLNEKYGFASHQLNHAESEVSTTSSDLASNTDFHGKDESGSVVQNTVNGKVNNAAWQTQIYQCSACKKQFSGPVPYEQHLTSNIHKKKLEKIENLARFKSGTAGGFAGTDALSDNQVNMSDVMSDNQVSMSDSLLNNNSMSSMETTFVCDSCGKTFPSIEMRNLHMLSSAHKVFKEIVCSFQDFSCTICDKKFTGKVPFIQHMNSSIHQKNVKRTEMFRNMLREETDHVAMDDDDSCNTFPAEQLRNIGLINNSSPVAECHVCKMKLYDKTEVMQHYESESHHENQNIYDYKKKVKVFLPENLFNLLA